MLQNGRIHDKINTIMMKVTTFVYIKWLNKCIIYNKSNHVNLHLETYTYKITSVCSFGLSVKMLISSHKIISKKKSLLTSVGDSENIYMVKKQLKN